LSFFVFRRIKINLLKIKNLKSLPPWLPIMRNYTFRTSILLFLPLLISVKLAAQGGNPCFQTITLESVTVGNSSCGNKTGFIVIQVVGNESEFTYSWTPSISGQTAGFDLGAGTYKLHIFRNNEPNCVLDTAIIINNTDGPVFALDTLIAPNCKATDGQIELAPATGLSYAWNNGKTGPINSGIGSGCYIATATNPANGCFSIQRFCVPATNRLETSYEIIKPAKCGRPSGDVKLTTTGGYGSYSYNISGSATIKGLSKGFTTAIITDDISGCKDTVKFFVPDAFPEANVNVDVMNVRCAGASDGFISTFVVGGANFTWPPSYSLTNASGNPVPLSGLSSGFYTLYIIDGDSCVLPPYSFFVQEPPPFIVTPSVKPEQCGSGGEITLSITGGNSTSLYYVDWNDLPGEQNGINRVNLGAGLYSATVYDSLFCPAQLDTVTVPTLCNKPDTLYRIVEVKKNETFCITPPVGLSTAQVTFTLQGGGSGGSSTYGSWELQPNGCLEYIAFNTPGYAVDTICVITNTGVQGLTQTTCFIISLSAKPPEKDSIFFTVQVNLSATACGLIPGNFDNPVVNLLDNSGLTGSSGGFGTYFVNDTSACITFQGGQLPGFNVAEICVSVFDLMLQQSYIVCYYPSVLPVADCGPHQFFQDTITLATTNCAQPSSVCLPIPYKDILAYAILDNGLPYFGGLVGCDYDTLFGYSIEQIPQEGPFVLNSWVVNNKVFGGSFPTLEFFPTLMNQIDSTGNWQRIGNYILGGDPNKVYGPIIATTPQGVKVIQPGYQAVPKRTQLHLNTGFHAVVFRHIVTGCTDTAYARILCFECPPVIDYPTNSSGSILWTTNDCNADTLFCTKILSIDLNNYTVTVNGFSPAEFTACDEYVGFRLDTGFHVIRIYNKITTCEYISSFYFTCEKLSLSDTASATVEVGQQITVCIDSTLISPPIISVLNTCPGNSNGNAAGSLNLQNKCVTFTGNVPGQDTVCIQICNTNGDCFTTTITIKVMAPQDSLVARPDNGVTLKDQPTSLDILKNDSYQAPVNVTLLTQPQSGTATFDPATGILTYTPGADKCGVDSLRYQLTDTKGRSSEATVRITIVCDKIFVFNGISPNGDNANDTWTIAGIESFPENVVRVFNRWGALVLEQKGYTNADPWGGRWNDQDLPDGTYFYIIDLGKDGGKLSGYLQIMR